MKQATFNIGGMHCASCVARNEASLKKLAGVTSATVNFATGTAQVDYDEAALPLSAIYKAITSNGYKIINKEQSHEESRHLLAKAKNKAVIAHMVTAPVLILAMGSFNLPFNIWGRNISLWIQAFLSATVIFGLGFGIHQNFLKQLARFSANMDSLISLGTTAAFGLSVWLMINNQTQSYYETGATVTALILLGRYFEALSRGQASEAVKKLLELSAKTARVITGNEIKEVPVEEIKIGNLLLIKPGEKIALDGVVTNGETKIDESMLTGESMPVSKKPGDLVFGGTINLNGVLEINVTKVGQNTVLAQIVKLVQDAQNQKAPIQKLADKIAGIFVPVVLVLAAATLCGWFFYTGVWVAGIVPAVAVLVVACPCALGLATPTAIMVGTGVGARRGILIKNGQTLEKAKSIDIVLFDKTGTLTYGKPAVTDVLPAPGHSKDSVLQLAASLEFSSEHPLAGAIVNAAKDQKLELKPTLKFLSVTGKGVTANINGVNAVAGNSRWLQELGYDLASFSQTIENLEKDAKTAIVLGQSQNVLGVIGVADKLKPESVSAVSALLLSGVNVGMITGDNSQTAQAIASALKIKMLYSQVLPGDKSGEVKKLQSQGKKVAFVGDGINDAPALAQADLGIAMGTGSDIAIEAGDIVLVAGNPTKVLEAIKLSQITLKKIKQNLFWAFFYNIAAIPLAALGLLNPMVAGGAMAFSSVSVVLNSLRLKKDKIVPKPNSLARGFMV